MAMVVQVLVHKGEDTVGHGEVWGLVLVELRNDTH